MLLTLLNNIIIGMFLSIQFIKFMQILPIYKTLNLKEIVFVSYPNFSRIVYLFFTLYSYLILSVKIAPYQFVLTLIYLLLDVFYWKIVYQSFPTPSKVQKELICLAEIIPLITISVIIFFLVKQF
jgi:hypothetical protein